MISRKQPLLKKENNNQTK